MVEKGKGFQIFANVLLALLSICAVAPFILLIMSSFTDEQVLISNGYSFFPAKFSTYAYEYLLTDSTSVIRGYGISFLITAVGTVCNLLLTTLYAYPLSRRDLPGRNGFAFYLFFTMLFSGGLVPSYMMWTQTFHIRDTLFALLIPNLLMGGFNVIMMRTYLNANIPDAVIEAARIDGASEWRTFTDVMFPMIKPGVGACAIFTFINSWNDYFMQLIMLISRANQTISVGIALMQSGPDANDFGLIMAGAAVAAVPILAVFIMFQRYFTQGITMGAVKG